MMVTYIGAATVNLLQKTAWNDVLERRNLLEQQGSPSRTWNEAANLDPRVQANPTVHMSSNSRPIVIHAVLFKL